MPTQARLFLFAFLTAVLMIALPVAAQTDCPASILLAIARAGSACNGLERNQACVGSGAVQSEIDGGAFTLAGDRIDLNALRNFLTFPTEAYPVVLAQVQANLRDNEQRAAALIAFGQINVQNLVPALPTLTVTSTGTLNIRTAPNIQGEIAARVGIRETVIANGRTDDGAWLRVQIPDTPANRQQNVPQIGWVSLDGPVSVGGNTGTLQTVDAADAFRRPFSVLSFDSQMDDAPCAGAPESGLLLQSPSVDVPVEILMSPLRLNIAGTVFLQTDAESTLILNVLDGGLELSELAVDAPRQWYVPAGSRFYLPSRLMAMAELQPLDPADLIGLPVNLLPQRIRVAAPLAQSEIDVQNATYYVPTPTPAPTLSPEERGVCQYLVRRDDSLRAGPGSFYEITNSVTRGQRVDPVLQTTDPDGGAWYQLRNGNWLPLTLVEQSGECQPVPVQEIVRPPSYNSIALEDCVTSNGPIRAGQSVTLTFVPAPWDTISEAQMATRVDPGTVTINDVGLRVYASEPILLGPSERYVRRFSATWQAEAGVHRIVGQRLSYVVSCDVTVPVG